VHGARLKAGGIDVVVKVQKPGVADTLKADLGFLAVAAKVLQFLAPDLGRLSLANVVADLRQSMLGKKTKAL
jgi:aarF domain-containing kinase